MIHDEARDERAHNAALVIAGTADGFRVHAPAEPRKIYLVSGVPEELQCNCPEFGLHRREPGWRCRHILAVHDRFFGGSGADHDPHAARERAAIQDEGSPQNGNGTRPPGGAAQMLLKRSASPDGRIDSLSVEFSCPVDDVPSGTIQTTARRMLQLQAAIISEFVKSPMEPTNGSQPGNGTHRNGSRNDPVPARLLAIGGMPGKWGRRLFITVDVDGETTRIFGNRKQLGDALVAAGHAALVRNIAEGVSLNVGCRVVAKPTDDGRYLNIVEVHPAEERRQ
ncbi:SWIM zinc finger family protein [bacterium]|nr:SWIM zinc finger family protein [bacterium]